MRKIEAMAILIISLAIFGCGGQDWYEKYGITERSGLLKEEYVPNLINALDDDDAGIRLQSLKYLKRFARNGKFFTDSQEEKIRAIAINDSAKNQEWANLVLKLSNDSKPAPTGSDLGLPDGSNISMTVDPYFMKSFYSGRNKRNAVPEHGVLPINLILKNESGKSIKIESYKLLDDSSRSVRDLSFDDTKQRFMYSINWVLHPTGGNAKKANQQLGPYLEKIWLSPKEISPGETIDGYLFYDVPKELGNIDGWKLSIGIKGVSGDLYIAESDISSGKTSVRLDKELAPNDGKSLESKLSELENLKNKGLITAEEYELKRTERAYS